MKSTLKYIIITLIFLSGCYDLPIVEWDNGRIPYYFSGEFSIDDIETIEEAMSSWENCCCVEFDEVIPRSNAYEIIRVNRTNVWASSIGENNVYNHMFIGYGGNLYGHVLHELGHCIGLTHEHQRPDRNQYVRIIWEKILPEYQYNFDIRDNPLIREEDYSYDFYSIMHYHSRGFSIDGSETILPVNTDDLNEFLNTGQREELSSSDIQKVREIYCDPLGDD